MICVSLPAKSIHQLAAQMQEAQSIADMVELRLDYLPSLDIQAIGALGECYPLPLILTLRSQVHGGFFKGDEQDRLKYLEELAKIKPAYIDFEHTISSEFLSSFR